jgi:selenocysteine lyase/cysteine desulfurase
MQKPHKFEAGTPNIAGGIALGTAVDYMNEVGFDNIQQQENELFAYGTARLLEIEGLKIYGTQKKSVISFNMKEFIRMILAPSLINLELRCAQVIIVPNPS